MEAEVRRERERLLAGAGNEEGWDEGLGLRAGGMRDWGRMVAGKGRRREMEW